jgi:hypothetical protein
MIRRGSPEEGLTQDGCESVSPGDATLPSLPLDFSRHRWLPGQQGLFSQPLDTQTRITLEWAGGK